MATRSFDTGTPPAVGVGYLGLAILSFGLAMLGCSNPGVQQPAPAGPVDAEEILADGLITPEENRAAADLAIACMRSRGVVIDDPAPIPSGLDFQYGLEDGPQQPETASDSFLSCSEEFREPIASAYGMSPEVEFARLRFARTVAVCVYGSEQAALEETGLADIQHIAGGPSQVHPKFEACADEARRPAPVVAVADEG